MSAVVAGKGMRPWAVSRAGSVPAAKAEATGSCWGCQPSPAAKKTCQGIIPQVGLPARGPNPGAGDVSEQEGWGVHFIMLLHQPSGGMGRRGEAVPWACPSMHAATEEQTRRGSGSADVWVGSLSLPSVRVVPPCSSGNRRVWLQKHQVYVFVRSACWKKGNITHLPAFLSLIYVIQQYTAPHIR